MSTQVVVNAGCDQQQQTAGNFNVRVHYKDLQDGGHLYGSYTTRERAECAVTTLAGRADIQDAIIEEAV